MFEDIVKAIEKHASNCKDVILNSVGVDKFEPTEPNTQFFDDWHLRFGKLTVWEQHLSYVSQRKTFS